MQQFDMSVYCRLKYCVSMHELELRSGTIDICAVFTCVTSDKTKIWSVTTGGHDKCVTCMCDIYDSFHGLIHTCLCAVKSLL